MLVIMMMMSLSEQFPFFIQVVFQKGEDIISKTSQTIKMEEIFIFTRRSTSLCKTKIVVLLVFLGLRLFFFLWIMTAARAISPHGRSKDGRIVNVASGSGHLRILNSGSLEDTFVSPSLTK